MRKKIERTYLTVFDVDTIADLYMDGWTIIKIAGKYHVDSRRIRRIIIDKGLMRRGYHNAYIVRRNKELISLYGDGMSLDCLAERFKISRQWIYKIIVKEAFHYILNKPKLKPQEEEITQ